MQSYIVIKPFSQFDLDYKPGQAIFLYPSDAQPLLSTGYLANITQQKLETWRTEGPFRGQGAVTCRQCSRPG